MWQSRVEIKGYSIAYFNRIATFEVLYHRTFIKGGAHNYALRRVIRYSCIYEASMSPDLNGSSAIRHFKHNNVIEIHDGITFDFYTGLPRLCLRLPTQWVTLHDIYVALPGRCGSLIVYFALPVWL